MRGLRSLILLLLAAPLAGFADFTEVQSVCPTCEHPTKDIVVLKSGATVWCNVVAENDDYWVLERFGELRAAFKSEVSSVRWGHGRSASSLEPADQILLTNDVVYNGTVQGEEPGIRFIIQTPLQKQTPSVRLIRSVHKAKHAIDFQKAPPPPPPKPAFTPKPAPVKAKPKAKTKETK
jgi:hypothetical protein